MLPISAETVLDEIRLLIAILSPEGTVLYVNGEVLRRSGERPDEIVGQAFSSIRWWTHKPGVSADVDQALREAASGRCTRLEVDAQISSVQRIVVDFEIRPQTDASGKIVALVVEGRDITDQRAVERKLRETQFRWRTIADFTVDWEFWLHPGGHFLYVSPACQRVSGYTPDEFMNGKISLSSVVNPEDRRRVVDLLTDAFSGSTGHSQRFRLTRRDRVVRWVSMSWQPVHDEEGKFMGVRGTLRDVDDLVKAEEELQRSAQAYRTLARHFPQGLVALLDRDFRFVICDGPALDTLPINSKNLVGKRVHEVLDRNTLSIVTPLIDAVSAGEEVADVLRFNGTAWLVHLTPIRDTHGSITHVIASAVQSQDSWFDGSEAPTLTITDA